MNRTTQFMNVSLMVALLLGIVSAQMAAGPPQSGETHRFQAEHYFNTFSFAHAPVLRINPGDRVITRTIDALGFDENSRRVADNWNPQTGPFYIEGAEPGDMLVVRIEKIEPNRTNAWSSQVLAPYATDPLFLRTDGGRVPVAHPCLDLDSPYCENWTVDLREGVARTTTADLQPSVLEIPLEPMLGCLGTAPPGKEAVSTATPGEFGGNMDYFGLVEGVTVMLPVYEPGALLFVGDGHARQGHGEVVGNALEISMDVEFSVDLVKSKMIGWPRIENDDYIMVLGSARPLLQALQHATTELQSWLMTDYGFDERAAGMLLGHLIEYEIANVVDPHYTVVAKLRKEYLEGN
jgi:acetamidase/formamidase